MTRFAILFPVILIALFAAQLTVPAQNALVVPWTEGLTLAQALVAAQYTFNWDPHTITVTRQGEVHPVNARRLLRGQDDPLLEPGDVVEVRH